MKKNLAIFLVGALGLIMIYCIGARSASAAVPSELWLEYVAAPGDSIRYVAHWTPPSVGADQRPIAGYDVQVVLGPGEQVLTSTTTAQVQATLTIARPAPGATLGPLTLRVRSRDTAGATSAWAVTSPWTVTHEALPPSPPGSVTVDSGSIAIALDSIIIRPQVVTMEVGTHLQLCPILFPTRGVPGLTLEYSAKPKCVAAYEAWLNSHQITA